MADSDCTDPDTCAAGSCQRPDGASCSDNSECGSTVCEQGSCASCADGKKNQDESDVDCGGRCSPCEADKLCQKNADCKSGVCDKAHCVAMKPFCPNAKDPNDCDGDKIPNVLEDKNQNGVVDPGEADPLKVDSDGDFCTDRRGKKTARARGARRLSSFDTATRSRPIPH